MKKNYNEDEYYEAICNNPAERIVIYGAGKYGGLLNDWCTERSIKIDSFCVSDASNNYSNIKGIRVRSIDDIVNEKISTLFLIAIKNSDYIELELEARSEYNYLPFSNWMIMLNKWARKRYESPIIEVTPTIGCRINCKYCPQGMILSSYNIISDKKEMTLEDYIFFVEKLPNNVLIDYSGFVEPFLNKQSIEMMEYTASMGLEMALYTTLENVDFNLVGRILKIPFREVVLHLPDEERYSKITIDATYKKILEILVNAKKEDGSPYIDSANCHGHLHHEIESIITGKVLLKGKMMDRAGNIANEKNDLCSNSILQGAIRCSRSKLLNHNVLLPDGTIVLCCNDYGMRHVLGNLRDSTYEEIMNSSTVMDIYDQMNQSKYDNLLCRNCIYAEVVNDLK